MLTLYSSNKCNVTLASSVAGFFVALPVVTSTRVLAVAKVLLYQNLVNLLRVFHFISNYLFKLHKARAQRLIYVMHDTSSLHKQTTRSKKDVLITERLCFQLFDDIAQQTPRYLLFLSLFPCSLHSVVHFYLALNTTLITN